MSTQPTALPIRLSPKTLVFDQPLHPIGTTVDLASLPTFGGREMLVARVTKREDGCAMTCWNGRIAPELAEGLKIFGINARYEVARKDAAVLEPKLKIPFVLDLKAGEHLVSQLTPQAEAFDLDQAAGHLIKGDAVIFGKKCFLCQAVHEFTACYTITAAALAWRDLRSSPLDWWIISGVQPQELLSISPFGIRDQTLEVIRTVSAEELPGLTLDADQMLVVWLGSDSVFYACPSAEAATKLTDSIDEGTTIEWNIGGRVPDQFLTPSIEDIVLVVI